MFEQQDCEGSAAWFSEIGPVNLRTADGKRAPIRCVDIHDPLPDDPVHNEGSRITLTFVPVHDGQEVGRIRGYPGEDFVRGPLDQLMQRRPPQS